MASLSRASVTAAALLLASCLWWRSRRYSQLASDDPLWFEERAHRLRAPGRALSQTNSPYTWVSVNKNAAFGPRYAHAAVINERQAIFVIGGAKGGPGRGEYLNDVWTSADQGRTWDVVLPRSSRFSPRRGHAAITDPSGIEIFVLGGFCGKACLANDVWSTESGSVWNSLGEAPWSARHGHAAVMTSGSWLVLLGGHDGTRYLGDVWKIHDPAQVGQTGGWIRSAEKAEWMPRYGHAVLIDKNDMIYMMGGFYAEKETGHVQCFNDVWRSGDHGSTWIQVTKHASWSGRYQHTADMSTSGNMFVTGGLSVDLERLPDVWRSKDGGLTWQLVTPTAAWPARYEHATTVDRNNTIYVLGGISSGSDAFTDVWRSEQTCADEVECTGETPVCRDGTHENFGGTSTPVCVGVCDRRIFDDCSPKEACAVQNSTPNCIDPCRHQECAKEQVCEVAPRDEVFRKELLSVAKAYCLSCDNARTKMSCGQLRQCKWSTEEEACLMRCSVMDEARCKDNDHCKWKGGDCSEK